MPSTPFTPSQHGFHFKNNYTNYFIDVFSIRITTSGRCGGMAYGALDHFFNNVQIPASQQLTVRGVDVSSRGREKMDIFAQDASDAIQHRYFFRNGWADWESIGGIVSSVPCTVSWDERRVDVFARGQNGALWHKWWDGQSWFDWEDLGGQLASGPDACSWGPGRLDVFIRGTDNALWHKWYDQGWSDWESLGGSISSDPSAVSWGSGRIDVFARGTDNAIWHKCYDQGWGAWESLGGVLASAPDACSWGQNRLDIFARGMNDEIWQKTWNGTRWLEWGTVQHDAVFVGDPTATSWGNSRIDLMAIGTDEELWHNVFVEGGWKGWNPLWVEVPGDETVLGDFIYRRQITSLVNQGPGYVSRLGSFWNTDADRFSWGVQEQHELGKLRRFIDRGIPVPLGLISVRAGIDVHHQVVAIGYDQGPRVEDLRIYIYDSNHPNLEVKMIPEPSQNCFRTELPDGSPSQNWRTYFVDEAYQPVLPLH